MILRECFPCEEKEKIQYNTFNIEDIRYIYTKIGDDYSREIFANRLMYSLIGDYEYIGKIVANTEWGKKIEKILEDLDNICIYGAGKRGTLVIKMFPQINWKGFIDKKGNGSCLGYPIYSLEDFEYKQDINILVSTVHEKDIIRNYLIENKKVPEERILVLDEYIINISDDIYFDSKYLKSVNMAQKIFMDLGCYDGKDTINAINYFQQDDIQVYALEPDNENYQNCINNLNIYKDKVQLIKKGIGSRKAIKPFQGGGTGAKFSETGESVVEIDTIDDIIGMQDVGFIKMDIEGYEEDAIAGGIETIKRCSPVLAVSVYHKKSDIWRIPLKILEINPSYQLYFGHYTFAWSDTVLYAISK